MTRRARATEADAPPERLVDVISRRVERAKTSLVSRGEPTTRTRRRPLL